ncbi:Bug family tripartite tricarboxylate transporter substrate binding protein [Variovorax sp. PBL-E5]|uniref:Bug family tripartite tricarboxylate transporter substrate binding protein n=1 Tax=Variovorax sp. PBL-E5 TaxID=434014 RepID=UPI0013173298|nr:tripartite tricarboxylate transporter substrate binding protein [Variovorax sp. PBL-E5]VTU45096.1 Argininosuccinate lyase [Variovorax sp. PBL-E5]
MHLDMSRRQWLSTLLASAAWPMTSHAAAYPSGPVTLVVPFSAGGQFDTIARQVARPMSADLRQPVIVENIGGAGGNIAASRVARARPDGQTMLMYGGNYSVARELYKKLDYDPVNDFAPVSRLSISPHVIMASPKLGITSFAQLRQRVKDGARLSYGSPGVGTSMHLTFEIIKDHFGLDVLHVPYKGGANVMTDLIGGQIDLGIIAVGPALEFIRGGKVVGLAVTSKARSPALPQVPAIAELGMPDLDAGSWAGLAVPRNTPEAVVSRLNTSAAAALKSPEILKLFERESFIATPGTPAEMREFNEREVRRYKPIIQKLNLQNQ